MVAFIQTRGHRAAPHPSLPRVPLRQRDEVLGRGRVVLAQQQPAVRPLHLRQVAGDEGGRQRVQRSAAGGPGEEEGVEGGGGGEEVRVEGLQAEGREEGEVTVVGEENEVEDVLRQDDVIKPDTHESGWGRHEGAMG